MDTGFRMRYDWKPFSRNAYIYINGHADDTAERHCFGILDEMRRRARRHGRRLAAQADGRLRSMAWPRAVVMAARCIIAYSLGRQATDAFSIRKTVITPIFG